MKTKININKEVSIDIPKLIEGGMVILANSGGGKSYAIRKIAEEAVSQVQTIIIDPEGEFASLREKYDFILAGKGADVPVEVRSASLLAIRLLELGKSAVIDLYELHPQERQRYVKLFCEAMVNCKKELYHPVLVILDEAHEYVPEGKPSEATWAVESLASKGRKRGQRLILASQRISKLSKNASAECNNKLIGRASQDIDMKRAGDELGFNKDKLKELRQLKPGEFFAFGPAISDEILKVKVGEVKTEHAKVGYKNANKVPPPSHVIKKILGELADLPAEAEKEAKTTAELKKENAELKRMNTNLLKHPFQKDETYEQGKKEGIDMANKAIAIANQKIKDNTKFVDLCYKSFQQIIKIASQLQKPEDDTPQIRTIPMRYSTTQKRPVKKELFIASPNLVIPSQKEIDKEFEITGSNMKPIGRCAQSIASYLYKHGLANKTQIAVATGYSRNSGGFNNALSELRSRGILMQDGDKYSVYADHFHLIQEVEVDVSLDKWLSKLGACAKKIWELLLTERGVDAEWPKAAIAERTGYSVTSGGFNNSISELSALGLVVRMSGGNIMINPELEAL